MRVACLRVPNLPLAAELRADPGLAGRPFAIASGPAPRAECIAVSPEAARRGVRPGSSVAQARAACAELRVRVASPALERAARDALLDAALGCSPRAALAPRASGAFAAEAAVHLDASGVTSLFHSERGFAAALCQRARAVGLPGDVAVASSRGVSRIAARALTAGADPGPEAREGRVLVLPPEEEAAFLAPLSLDLLDPDDALAGSLTRFGVTSVRDLLALPRRGLATRLGPGVLRLVALARGEETGPPLPAPGGARLAEAVDLELPVDRLEPLLFVLQGLLSRLLARLAARHLACGDFALTLELAGGGRDARRLGVAAPTRDRRVLVRLLRHALETRPPQAAVLAAGLETEGCPFESDQLDLFRPAGPAPAALAPTLAALSSWCGADRVGAPAVADDHRPEAFGLRPFDPRAGALPHSFVEARPETSPAALAVRALRPPVRAEVRSERGVPAWIRSAVATGPVVRAAGPWRTSGAWWSREEHFDYECFDVQTRDGSVLRLRFDRLRRFWQVDAVYD